MNQQNDQVQRQAVMEETIQAQIIDTQQVSNISQKALEQKQSEVLIEKMPQDQKCSKDTNQKLKTLCTQLQVPEGQSQLFFVVLGEQIQIKNPVCECILSKIKNLQTQEEKSMIDGQSDYVNDSLSFKLLENFVLTIYSPQYRQILKQKQAILSNILQNLSRQRKNHNIVLKIMQTFVSKDSQTHKLSLMDQLVQKKCNLIDLFKNMTQKNEKITKQIIKAMKEYQQKSGKLIIFQASPCLSLELIEQIIKEDLIPPGLTKFLASWTVSNPCLLQSLPIWLQKMVQKKKYQGCAIEIILGLIVEKIFQKEKKQFFFESPKMYEILIMEFIKNFPPKSYFNKYGRLDVSSLLQQRIKKIIEFILIACEYKLQKVIQFRSIITDSDPIKQKFEVFVECLSSQLYSQIVQQSGNSEENELILTTVLLLIESPNRKKDLLSTFWEKCKGEQFITITQKLNKLFCVLMHSQQIMIQAKASRKFKKIMNIKQKRNQYLYTPEEEKFLEENFRYRLYHAKQFYDLAQFRENGLLQFSNAVKILNEVCFWDKQNEVWQYCSDKKYEDSRFYFQYPGRNHALYYLDENRVNLKTEIRIQPYLEQFIVDFFFQNQICEYFIQKITDQNEDYYDEYVLMAVLIFLIVIDKFSKEKKENVHSFLYSLKDNQNFFQKFQMANEIHYLERILCLKDVDKIQQEHKEQETRLKMMKEKEEQERKKLQELKQKALQKKKQKLQKFKKTQAIMLQQMPSKSQGVNGQDDEKCLLCHERRKKDRPIIYAANVKSSNFLTTRYRSNLTSYYLVSTCFHPIHIDCFLKQKQLVKSKGFKCPLCSKSINCFLPTRYDPEQEQINQTMIKQMLSAIGNQEEKHTKGHFFEFLLRYLIWSSGVSEIVFLEKYGKEKKKNWHKSDIFIEKILEEMYIGDSQKFKQVYQNVFKEILNHIAAMQNKLLGKIQQCIVKAIYCKMNLQDFKAQHIMQQIKNQLVPEQFEVFKKSIEDLLNEQVKIEEEQKQEGNGEKKIVKTSLSYKQIPLPSNSQVLKQLLIKAHECNHSGNDINNERYLSLINGVVYCQGCYTCDRLDLIQMVLDIDNGLIIYFVNGKRKSMCIYENGFKDNYDQKPQYQEQDLYEINVEKYTKQMKNYLSIDW